MMASEFDEPDPGFSKRLWAAYVLGRYPHALMAWHEAFFNDPRELSHRTPPEALNASLDEFPDLYLDLDEAILELALAHELDPNHHVEIRNFINRSEAASRELLNAVDETPAGESISEIVYYSRRPLHFLKQISKAAELQSRELELWRQLGDLVGTWWWILESTDLETIRPWQAVDEFLDQLEEGSIRERFRPVVDDWHALQQLGTEATSLGQIHSSVRALEDRVAELDVSFLRSQRGAVAGGPLLIVDRTKEQLEFLGCQFRFDEFKGHAQAGLKCFLYLSEHPQSWCTRSTIVAGAEIEVELEHLPTDISHFRKIVTPATKPYGQRFAGELRRDAEAAFMIPKREKRHQGGAGGSYKLAIDADRIELRG